ncbi:hypothetical protein DAQ1742_00578 [Dickeya aquatica]|uniref:Uncharacterized protein n=1 Tax=Dickeya aquatica TaxID=1401087 RepID=A0A375A6M1_9GAMM|nr:hypothetical protein DAQ1742_00578 [Dickeya aquatica]
MGSLTPHAPSQGKPMRQNEPTVCQQLHLFLTCWSNNHWHGSC